MSKSNYYSKVFSLSLILLLFSFIKLYAQVNTETKLEDKETSPRDKFAIYLNSGFYIGLTEPSINEIYSSLGLMYFPSDSIDITWGVFATLVNAKPLLTKGKKQILFAGLEVGFAYYPIKFTTILDLYTGINVAFTIWPSLYTRSSILLGTRFHLSRVLDIDIRYSINYSIGSELDFFISHLFGLYLVFYI